MTYYSYVHSIFKIELVCLFFVLYCLSFLCVFIGMITETKFFKRTFLLTIFPFFVIEIVSFVELLILKIVLSSKREDSF